MRINLETAKLAKEKGYDESCSSVFVDGKPKELGGIQRKNSTYQNQITRPIQSDLQKWLRDVHNIFVEVNTDCTSAPKFSFNIKQFVGNPNDLSEKEWDWIFPVQNENWGLDRTYEISLEAGLQEALKLIGDEDRS
jgi:hypothetical protein